MKLGLDAGTRLLDVGCNDLGGTLMDETISRAAGASHGQTMTAEDFERAIVAAGRTPSRRTTLYGAVDPDHVPISVGRSTTSSGSSSDVTKNSMSIDTSAPG